MKNYRRKIEKFVLDGRNDYGRRIMILVNPGLSEREIREIGERVGMIGEATLYSQDKFFERRIEGFLERAKKTKRYM